MLDQARDAEDLLDLARRWANDRRFQVGVQSLKGLIDTAAATAAWSRVAEAALRCLLPPIEAEFARAHGRIAGCGMAIVGMGKLGGGEMTATSDLDLIFVYSTPPEGAQSDGAAAAAGAAVLRPAEPAADQRPDRTDLRGPPLRGGHAAAALRQGRSDRRERRHLRPLPARGGVGLGADGADPRPRRRRSARSRPRASRRSIRSVLTRPRDPRGAGRRRRRHARADGGGASPRGQPVGAEASARRPGRHRVHRPVPAASGSARRIRRCCRRTPPTRWRGCAPPACCRPTWRDELSEALGRCGRRCRRASA